MKSAQRFSVLGALLLAAAFASSAHAQGIGFVKVCNNGKMAGSGTCPSNPVLGTKPKQWGCTWDTSRGVMWQLGQSDGGTLDKSRQFTRFEPSTPGYGDPTDSAGFAVAVNEMRLCGSKKWRLPTLAELSSSVDRRFVDPAIDLSWFPNTYPDDYWTSELFPFDLRQAYTVNFFDGVEDWYPHAMTSTYVRLVAKKIYTP